MNIAFMHRTAAGLLPVLLMAAASAVHAQTIEQGGVLRDKAGRTLYVFDKDRDGRSQCHDGCLTVWPAFIARDDARASGDHTLHQTPDGRMQWGWKGRPLYYYAADAKVGDMLGDGVGGTWHIVRIQPLKSETAAPSGYGGYGYGY